MTAVLAGTLHERAQAFTAENLRNYDKSGVYRDMSTVLAVPTRGMIPIEVVNSWLALALPVNQQCAGFIHERGKEVAAAYESLFAQCVDEKTSRAKYGDYAQTFLDAKFIVTMEEDNIPPGDGLLKLLGAIRTCDYCGGEVGVKYNMREEIIEAADGSWNCITCEREGFSAVSGLYWMKTDPPTPMAFGDPKHADDFKPRRVSQAVQDGEVIEVNGIAMGFAVWRADLFRKVSRPWFETRDECTQDIYFCKKARAEAGARFGVHCGVRVGHLNVKTGEIV